MKQNSFEIGKNRLIDLLIVFVNLNYFLVDDVQNIRHTNFVSVSLYVGRQ